MPSSHLTLCWQADATAETAGKPRAQGMVVYSLADSQYTGFFLFFPSRHWEARCWPVAGQDKKRMPGETPSLSSPPHQDKPPLPRGLKWWRVCLQCGRPRFNPWVWKIPRRRAWLPTPVFVPGKCHGQRSLAGYSPWGRRVGHDWGTHTLTFTMLLFAVYSEVVSDSLLPMGCSPPGCSVHGISQARILEWVAISFSRGSPQPRD